MRRRRRQLARAEPTGRLLLAWTAALLLTAAEGRARGGGVAQPAAVDSSVTATVTAVNAILLGPEYSLFYNGFDY